MQAPSHHDSAITRSANGAVPWCRSAIERSPNRVGTSGVGVVDEIALELEVLDHVPTWPP
jgi:hypothetical protein